MSSYTFYSTSGLSQQLPSRALYAVRQVSLPQFFQHLQRLQPGCPLPSVSGAVIPAYIFQNMSEGQQQRPSSPIIAFHGTAFERLHSIMNTGE